MSRLNSVRDVNSTASIKDFRVYEHVADIILSGQPVGRGFRVKHRRKEEATVVWMSIV